MDIVTLSHQIDDASQKIQALMGQIDRLGEEYARADAEYDKQVAVTLVQLKNGVELDLCGVKIVSPPASTAERIAKGICHEARYKALLTENALKACQMKLRAAMAVLSGRQSKNKYLDIEP